MRFASTGHKLKGVVKFFDSNAGWGFLTNSETGEDVFVHWTQIETENNEWQNLHPSQAVEFEMGYSLKGPAATHVRVLGD